MTLLDTAGLRDSDDVVESIGISRAVDRANAADLRIFLGEQDASGLVVSSPSDIHVSEKADLEEASDGVSGKTGQGVDQLLEDVRARLDDRYSAVGIATHERHRVAMTDASTSISDAQFHLNAGADRYEMVAEEIRSAVRSLEVLVGRIDVENLLDEIFASFCLGK